MNDQVCRIKLSSVPINYLIVLFKYFQSFSNNISIIVIHFMCFSFLQYCKQTKHLAEAQLFSENSNVLIINVTRVDKM